MDCSKREQQESPGVDRNDLRGTAAMRLISTESRNRDKALGCCKEVNKAFACFHFGYGRN